VHSKAQNTTWLAVKMLHSYFFYSLTTMFTLNSCHFVAVLALAGILGIHFDLPSILITPILLGLSYFLYKLVEQVSRHGVVINPAEQLTINQKLNEDTVSSRN
jgi:hypothetical protein